MSVSKQSEYSSLVIFAFVNGLIKISVLLFYRRIFVVIYSWRDARNFFFIFMAAVIGLLASVSMFMFMFMCGKDSKVFFETPELIAEKCVDTLKVGWLYAVADFTSDGIIILIPLPFVRPFPSPSSHIAIINRILDLETPPAPESQDCSNRLFPARYPIRRSITRAPSMDASQHHCWFQPRE